MADTPKPEEMVPDDFQHDYDERQKELNKKILDKVAEDPDFRGHLLEDPEGALEKAGLAAEAKALDNVDAAESRLRRRGSLDVAQQVLLALRDPLPLEVSRTPSGRTGSRRGEISASSRAAR